MNTQSQHRFNRQAFTLVAAAALMTSLSGCATILSERRYPVTINNTQGPTYFSVHDRENNVVHQGLTPQQVTLDAKSSPFRPAKYSVAFAGAQSTTQVKELKAGFDPWTAGNIVLGGVPGFIVDGATGAMFKLPKTVQGNVAAEYAVTDPNQGTHLIAAAKHGKAPARSNSPPTQEPQVQVASVNERTNSSGNAVTGFAAEPPKPSNAKTRR